MHRKDTSVRKILPIRQE